MIPTALVRTRQQQVVHTLEYTRYSIVIRVYTGTVCVLLLGSVPPRRRLLLLLAGRRRVEGGILSWIPGLGFPPWIPSFRHIICPSGPFSFSSSHPIPSHPIPSQQRRSEHLCDEFLFAEGTCSLQSSGSQFTSEQIFVRSHRTRPSVSPPVVLALLTCGLAIVRTLF